MHTTSMNLLLFGTRILLLGILMLCQLVADGQVVFRHSKPIEGLELDGEGRLLVRDADTQYYSLSDSHLRASDTKPFSKSIPKYIILQGRLQENLGDGFHLYESSTQLYDVVSTADGQQLVAGESGLLLFDQGQFRTFHIPGITFPRSLIQLAVSGDKLAMKTREGSLSVYDLSEQTLESVASNVDHFIWDKWHTLWYSQGRALNFNVDHINALPPLLEVTSIQDGHEQSLELPRSLEVGSDLTINYRTVYPPMLDEPEVVYRLRAEDNWRQAASTSQLKIRDLASGAYEIQLRAKGLGEATTFSEVIKVKVESDIVSRLWPWLTGALLGLLMLVLISFLRLRNQLGQLKTEKEKIKLQSELNEKKQKIGQLQMNPHFLFNTLNSISGLIALNENKKARKYLNQFSQMMRKMLDGSRKDFLTLAEEKTFLVQYLSLEAMCRNQAFDYEVIIDADLDSEKKIPAMILQPLVENAIIHGLSHKKDNDRNKGHITVHFQKSDKQIKATVQDNGIGRAAAQQFRSETESHNSAAMDIIQERLAALNKWSRSSVVYTDLYGEDGVVEGTRVEVVF